MYYFSVYRTIPKFVSTGLQETINSMRTVWVWFKLNSELAYLPGDQRDLKMVYGSSMYFAQNYEGYKAMFKKNLLSFKSNYESIMVLN